MSISTFRKIVFIIPLSFVFAFPSSVLAIGPMLHTKGSGPIDLFNYFLLAWIFCEIVFLLIYFANKRKIDHVTLKTFNKIRFFLISIILFTGILLWFNVQGQGFSDLKIEFSYFLHLQN